MSVLDGVRDVDCVARKHDHRWRRTTETLVPVERRVVEVCIVWRQDHGSRRTHADAVVSTINLEP